MLFETNLTKTNVHNQELSDYIAKELSRGVSVDELRSVLIGAGWPTNDVDAYLSLVKNPNPQNVTETHPLISHESPKPKRPLGKAVKVTAVALGVLLILAGGAYASYTYIIPPPAKILQEATQNFQNVKSFDYSGKITVDVTSEGDLFSRSTWVRDLQLIPDERVAGSTSTRFGIDFTGSTDVTDEKYPKTDLEVNINADIFTFGFNVRVLGKTVFLKFDQIPEIAEGATQYAGVWIKADLEEISKQFGMEINLKNGQPDLTEGQEQQLEDLVKNAHFFSGITKLAGDVIDGENMHHYALAIDKQGLKNYLDEVNRIVASAGGFTDGYSEVFDGIEFSNVEVWVGKSDKMIHRISGVVYQKPTSSSIDPSGSLNFLMNFKNFNNPKSIEEPVDARNIMDVINEFMGDAQSKSRDARRLSDIRQMMTGLEIYYNEYGKYPGKLTDMKTILPVLPAAPTPADGNCTEEQNSYIYKPKPSREDYTLTFCLGTSAGGFGAGPHSASFKGIE